LPGRKEFERQEFLSAAGITPSEIASVDLAMDIQTLIEKGRSDEEIVEELELALEGAKDLIAEIRSRYEFS
jgi:orotate phosphoribosyltransferase-like protein